MYWCIGYWAFLSPNFFICKTPNIPITNTPITSTRSLNRHRSPHPDINVPQHIFRFFKCDAYDKSLVEFGKFTAGNVSGYEGEGGSGGRGDAFDNAFESLFMKCFGGDGDGVAGFDAVKFLF